MTNLNRNDGISSDSGTGLLDNFSRYLDAELALNEDQRNEAHRLRYDVYCEERGYEDPESFPDKLEVDDHDHHSVHALVRHRASDLVAGVVRLVFADMSAPQKPLPIEQHCGHSFNQSALKRFDFSRQNVAEVSRFAVSNKFIRYAGNTNPVIQAGRESDGRTFDDEPSQYLPHISMGLIAMLFVASAQHRISHWYAVMEPSLSRLLGRSGIEFTRIGPVVNYHGRRQPMIASVNDLLSNIYTKRYDFFRLIDHLGGVPADFQPGWPIVTGASQSDRLISVS